MGDIEPKNTAIVWVLLRVENNNKFVRGKNKVIEWIEGYLTHDYQMRRPTTEKCDYIITVPYISIEDLKNRVNCVLEEMDREADFHNCFIEADIMCEELGFVW